MRLLAVLLPVIDLLFAAHAFAATRYICNATQATGLQRPMNSELWRPFQFVPKDTLVVNSPSARDRDLAALNWHKSGNVSVALMVRRLKALGSQMTMLFGTGPTPVAACKKGFSAAGMLTCAGFADGGEFRMNRDTGRFIYYSDPFWYLMKSNKIGRILFMEVGICANATTPSP